MKGNRAIYVAQAAMIAALYVVLTYFGTMLGMRQLRFSEALCVLPFFTAAAVPGLTLGCAAANLLTGCALWDVVFGSLATCIGACLASWLSRKHWSLAPWPNALANTLALPLILQYVYLDTSRTLWGFVLYIGISELISGVGLGYLLLQGLKPHARLFRM